MKGIALILLVGAGCYDANELSAGFHSDLSASVDGAPDLSAATASIRLLAGGLGGAGGVDGIGSAARFSSPMELAYDGHGTLYVTDHGNSVVRKIDIATRQVSRVTGLFNQPGYVDGPVATAMLNGPQAISVDGDDLWVTDLNNRIFEISQGQVTTVRRSVTSYGLVVQNGALYYSDYTKNQVLKLDLALDGAVSEPEIFSGKGTAGLLGGTPRVAEFSSPTSLIGYEGGFLLADQGNFALRIIDAAGNVSTTAPSIPYAASTGAPLQTPYFGIAADATGNIYVANASRDEIDEVKSQLSPSVVFSGRPDVPGNIDGKLRVAEFSQPDGIAFDGNNTLFIADRANHTVRAIALDTLTVSTIAGSPPQFGNTDSLGASARFMTPIGLTFDATKQLIYIADSNNHRLRTVDLMGNTSTLLVNGSVDAGALPTFVPVGVATDAHGNVYFSDATNNAIYEIDVGGEIRLLAGSAIGGAGSNDGTGMGARFSAPNDIVFDPMHDVFYVADSGNNRVRVVTTTGVVTTLNASFSGAVGLAYDAVNNELYVAETQNHVIRRISFATNTVSLVAGVVGKPGHMDGPAATAQFSFPHELALDGVGSLYVADRNNSTIRKIDLKAGQVSTFAGVPGSAGAVLGPLPGQLNFPFGLAWVPGFGLVVSMPSENAIVVIH